MSEPSRAARDDLRAYLVAPVPPQPFGKYIVIGKLGHGGMAEVNLAVVGGKGGFRKLFVLKRLHPHLESEEGFVEMFLDEARLAAQLDHPNCVQTVEVGEDNGQHFLAMEYLDGQGLERLLRVAGQSSTALPLTVSVRIIADALDGLHHAHELRGFDGTPLGVVHRDISPQNIFITYNGVVKLLDFGIAKAESNIVETRTGIVKGKYAYIAPEQAMATPVDRRADLWSMAVVLWEMLTSHRLFKSVNELATLNETLHGTIHPPSAYNPEIPPELDAIVFGGLQRDVSQRYPTALAFKEALESWLETQTDPSDRKAIAALMRERFADILPFHKQRLHECMAAVGNDPRSLERLLHSGSASLDFDRSRSVSLDVRPAAIPSVTPSHIAPRIEVTPSRSGARGEVPVRSAPPPPPVLASLPRPAPAPSFEPTPSTSRVAPLSGFTAALPAMEHIAPRPPSGEVAPSFDAPPAAPSPLAPVAAPAGPPAEFTPPPTETPRRRPWLVFGLALVLILGGLGLAGALVLRSLYEAPVTSPATPTPGVLTPPVAHPSVTRIAEPVVPEPVVPEPVVPEPVVPEPVVPEPVVPGALPVAVVPEPVPSLPNGHPSRTGRDPRRHPRIAAALAPATPPVTPPTATPPPAPEARTATGTLTLVTSPWTHVTAGSRDLGETPIRRFELPAGRHTLRLRNPEANIDQTYEVEIRAGEDVSRRLGLR